jgi:hypothetical protein
MAKVSALTIMSRSSRFDLIPKFLLAKNWLFGEEQSDYLENLYLSSIEAFNGFYEHEPRKTNKRDFIESFRSTVTSMSRSGWQELEDNVRITVRGEPLSGAHRIASAAVLGISVEVDEVDDTDPVWTYEFFTKRGFPVHYADRVALESVNLNSSQQILLVHSCVPSNFDEHIKALIQQNFSIFYERQLHLSREEYVGLKWLSYAPRDGQESWIGTDDDSYRGLRGHARSSFGVFPLRIFLLRGKAEDLVATKNEIRSMVGLGNFSVHSADTQEERLALAQSLLNANSRHLLSDLSILREKRRTEAIEVRLRNFTTEQGIELDSLVVGGSGPLAVYGMREIADIDLVGLPRGSHVPESAGVSSHESERLFYPAPWVEIVNDPQFYFWFRGLKFITLPVLRQLKMERNEKPKDIQDIHLIDEYLERYPQLTQRAMHTPPYAGALTFFAKRKLLRWRRYLGRFRILRDIRSALRSTFR